jgi:hypothetical protein
MRILRELGYVENQNFDIVYRSSGGNQDRPRLPKNWFNSSQP